MDTNHESGDPVSSAKKEMWARIAMIIASVTVFTVIACVAPISIVYWQDNGREMAISEAGANLTGAKLSVELFVFRNRKAPKTLQEADAEVYKSLTGRCYRAEDYHIISIEQEEGRVLRAELKVSHRNQYPSVVLYFGDLISTKIDVVEP